MNRFGKFQNRFDFFDSKSFKTSFGGNNLKSNPKSARPISTKHLMHVILKSDRATGRYSFLKIERIILSLVRSLSLKLNVQVLDVVVMSNHIHLSLRVKSRRSFQNYLRALSGIIARKILQNEKTKILSKNSVCFFSGRPFSRIVASGKKSYRSIVEYFELNRLEKRGFSKAESRFWNLHKSSIPPLCWPDTQLAGM